MNYKEVMIEKVSPQFKLVRVEANYTQDEMAHILGISKKTLIQIEKGRQMAGWSHVVVLCALFSQSAVLQGLLGDDPVEAVRTAAHGKIDWHKPITMGGKVWWQEIDAAEGFVVQQNRLSRHFRILDGENRRWYSAMERSDIQEVFERLVKEARGAKR